MIINQYDLAQINEGIKRQKGTNIKRLNLVYRARRDGGKYSDYHSKCDGCKNILILVETQNGRKFGGFSSLRINKNEGKQYDNTAFIFSLDKKENYFIKKGKSAMHFRNEYGPIFGEDYSLGSEFTISRSKSCSYM